MPRVTLPHAAGENPRARIAESARRSTVQATQRANRRRAMPRWAMPTLRIGLRAVPVLAVAGLVAWAWGTGTVASVWSAGAARFHAGTANAGLAVAEILVTGREETDKGAILAALGVERGSPILAFDPHEAQRRLLDIPWVAAARVERRLPDTIFVSLDERRPMALWQNDRTLRLVDGEGHVLSDTGLERWHHLPMLVGPEAQTRGPAILAILAAEPTIAEKVKVATLVSGRRWDLKLKNGVDIRLPETGVAEALRQLATVQETNKVLERDIVAIDLRTPDRLAVQTSAAAAERRRAPPKKI